METEIVRSRRKSFGLEIRNGKAIAHVPLYATEADVTRFLERNQSWLEAHMTRWEQQRQPFLRPDELEALRQQAQRDIPERVRHYASLLSVQYGRITIRSQRTRWGSCSSKGNLNFNCLLMLAPEQVRDSVVVHELCHRLEMNHSERFYRHVLSVCPDYRVWAKWLRDNGQGLLSRLEP